MHEDHRALFYYEFCSILREVAPLDIAVSFFIVTMDSAEARFAQIKACFLCWSKDKFMKEQAAIRKMVLSTLPDVVQGKNVFCTKLLNKKYYHQLPSIIILTWKFLRCKSYINVHLWLKLALLSKLLNILDISAR